MAKGGEPYSQNNLWVVRHLLFNYWLQSICPGDVHHISCRASALSRTPPGAQCHCDDQRHAKENCLCMLPVLVSWITTVSSLPRTTVASHFPSSLNFSSQLLELAIEACVVTTVALETFNVITTSSVLMVSVANVPSGGKATHVCPVVRCP